jgi:oxygen-independent coproporphyrinogen III oxidase
MAGIYIHIPFCKQACNYCDFYFTTRAASIPDFAKALHTEIDLQKHYFPAGTVLDSVYFGGGTPSLMRNDILNGILAHIQDVFPIRKAAEITLEANPDDVDCETASQWLAAGVNRISLGLQSLSDHDLQFMHRAHTAKESFQALQMLKDAGFKNITVDFIYGIPDSGNDQWRKHLEYIQNNDIPHFSAYALTVEKGTRLAGEIDRGKTSLPPEIDVIHQFEILQEFAQSAGYEPYEISNYAKSGFRAVHNTAYWFQKPYLGLGPSAHSYLMPKRKHNLPDLKAYIAALSSGALPPDAIEVLSPEDMINEFIMTRLRLSDGIPLQTYTSIFGHSLQHRAAQYIQLHADAGDLKITDEWLKLTRKGKLMADRIASDLFIASE